VISSSSRPAPLGILGYDLMIDFSQVPLELVDRYDRFRDWRFQPIPVHPDLWGVLRWVD
jgi:hypothetical protein